MSEPTTPLMQQYHAIKARYPHALLLFRLGDFYELFYEDAIIASRELQITLTSRNREKGQPIPMCGVPYHAADSYIARLIRAGFKVAICEQMEQPGPGKKLVRREVTRVITPGTATDVAVLDARENNFLAAVAQNSSAAIIGLALVDLSTGEFQATEFSGPAAEESLRDELQLIRKPSPPPAPSCTTSAKIPPEAMTRPASKPFAIWIASAFTSSTTRSSSTPSPYAISNSSLPSSPKNPNPPAPPRLSP